MNTDKTNLLLICVHLCSSVLILLLAHTFSQTHSPHRGGGHARGRASLAGPIDNRPQVNNLPHKTVSLQTRETPLANHPLGGLQRARANPFAAARGWRSVMLVGPGIEPDSSWFPGALRRGSTNVDGPPCSRPSVSPRPTSTACRGRILLGRMGESPRPTNRTPDKRPAGGGLRTRRKKAFDATE